MQIPQNFTISPSSQKGDVYGTEFTFTANLPGEFTSFAWDFGDKQIAYRKSSVTHTYNYPGIYTITLSAWTDYGKIYVEEGSVDVDYFIRDRLVFSRFPELFNLPGFMNYDPFVISLTSTRIHEPLAVYLQVFGTKSVPYYTAPEKWRFLTPTWSITNASTSAVVANNLLTVPTEPIYNKEKKIVAVKGSASFFYTDSFPTDPDPVATCPILFGATLSTQHFVYPKESLIYPYNSYANTDTVRAVLPWQVTDNIPTTLKVTENFISDVYPLKWTNVPIPIMLSLESDPGLLESFVDEQTVVTTSLGYPSSNLLGAQYPVVLTLSANRSLIPRSEFTYGVHFSAEKDRYFQTYDEYGNLISGYVFTSITPFTNILTAVAPDTSFVVLASTILTNTTGGDVDEFKFPYGYPIRSNVYVSHPARNHIHKLSVTSYPKYCQTVAYYEERELLPEGMETSFINVPALTTVDVKSLTLSGTSEVYGMAFNPIRNRLYAADAEQNSLVQYDSFNTILTSVQLSSIFKSEILAPAHLSIDRKFNVWVSLFDDHRLAKFDYKLRYLLSAAPVGLTGTKNLSTSPPVVETDRQNRVWACWSHPVSSMLVKFDQYGNQLYKATPFPGNSNPVSIAIDPQNYVWVACKHLDSIRRYTNTGALDRDVPLFIRPSYIALDRRADVWVAHGYNLCSKYETRTRKLSTWKFITYYDKEQDSLSLSGVYLDPIDDYTPNYTQKDWELGYSTDEIWGGMTTDVYNRVWIIDSVNNVMGTFFNNEPLNVKTIPMINAEKKTQVVLPNTTFVSEVSTQSSLNPKAGNIRSAQAGGDWTGNRWYQKYAGILVTLPVYGQSAPFKLYDIDNSFNLPKVNETFNFASYLKNLPLPEHFKNNNELFDKFLAAIVGDSDPSKESVGRVVYERIANFVESHGDFETAEIEQLKSFAELMSLDVKTFGEDFPAAINRLLSTFSIPKNRLRGVPELNPNIEENIGRLIFNYNPPNASLSGTDLLTYNQLTIKENRNLAVPLTAGQYYLFKDKKYNTSRVVYAGDLLDGTNVYPISALQVVGLREPFLQNYTVYEYISENYSGKYTGNLLDWNSIHNTISYNLSTNEDWYGDAGLVETLFNKILTKHLYQE
jgi:hypothetical protein